MRGRVGRFAFAFTFAFAFASTTAIAGETAEREVFAVIVTSNRSSTLGRPELRYADDDGAKYYELFSMLAPKENVALLSELDRDTAQLYPDLVADASAPTLKNLRARIATIAEDVRRATESGKRAEFYFIFAGHGDVDRGRGFLELADAPLDADTLEGLLGQVRSQRTHVIIDACNSFFVIAPRKPGGRRFATPADAAEGIAQRLPRVGVFLSTSAEAEVFEWSELQSGIFSHAVRSGLSGAADANSDGDISYQELAAFVTVASRKVKNPLFRPQVFSRGPGGDNASALVALDGARAEILKLPAAGKKRMTIRDRNEIPVVDLHKADGLAMSIRLPKRVDPVAGAIPVAARGPSDMLQALFSDPFSESEVEAFVADQLSRPRPFGVSREYVDRMGVLMSEMYRHERNRRIVSGITLASGAVSLALPAIVDLAVPAQFQVGAEVDAVMLGISAALGLGATLVLVLPNKPMKMASKFRNDAANPSTDMAALVARSEREILALAKSEHAGRVGQVVTGGALLAIGLAGSIALGVLTSPFYGIAGAIPTIAGGAIMGQALFETPLERLIRQWREDPIVTRATPSATVRPYVGAAQGGGSLGVWGRF